MGLKPLDLDLTHHTRPEVRPADMHEERVPDRRLHVAVRPWGRNRCAIRFRVKPRAAFRILPLPGSADGLRCPRKCRGQYRTLIIRTLHRALVHG